MNQQIVNIITEDSLSLQGIFFSPTNGPTSGKAVLHLHDWYGHFLDDFEFVLCTAEYLAERGHCFLSMNTRGANVYWGQHSEPHIGFLPDPTNWTGGAYDIFDECTYDIQAGIEFLANKACPDIVLEGIGLGASKIAFYQSNKRNEYVKSIVINAPKDFVGVEMAQSNYLENLAVAKDAVTAQKNEGTYIRTFGYPITPKSYLSIFGEVNRRKGIHWLEALSDDLPHDLDDISLPILVIQLNNESGLRRLEFLDLLKDRVSTRILTVNNIQPAQKINDTELLAQAISDWIEDVLP